MSDDNPYAPPEADITVETNDDLAGRGRRLGGAIIDSILLLATVLPAIFVLGYWDVFTQETTPLTVELLVAVIGFGIFLLLNGYLLANHGQTIGKRVVKTRIVSVNDGRILPFWKLVGLRYVPYWGVSYIPIVGGLLGLINVLFIFRADRRCVHDHIAGTKVVNAG